MPSSEMADKEKDKPDGEKKKAPVELYRGEENFITRVTQRHHHDAPSDLKSRTMNQISKLWRLSTRQQQYQQQQQGQQHQSSERQSECAWRPVITDDYALHIYRRKPEKKAKLNAQFDLNQMLALNVHRTEENDLWKYLSIQLFFTSGLVLTIDFSAEATCETREGKAKIRSAKKLHAKIKEISHRIRCSKPEPSKCHESCRSFPPLDATLPAKIEVEKILREGTKQLTHQAQIFTWEGTEERKSKTLYKSLKRMTFRNELNQLIELSKADFLKWQFDKRNPQDGTVKGRLHTSASSCLGHVVLTIIFDDPYGLFWANYMPLLDGTSIKLFEHMRQWNKEQWRIKRENDMYPSPPQWKFSSITPPQRSQKSQSRSFADSNSATRKDANSPASESGTTKAQDHANGVKGQLAEKQQTLNSIGNANSFSPGEIPEP